MPNIPHCANCEDGGRLKHFRGFYQARYGLQRYINVDGTLTDYVETSGASQKKAYKMHGLWMGTVVSENRFVVKEL